MVITIGREFGSGGKYIGEKLAQDLNMKLYGKEILSKVAEESGIDLKVNVCRKRRKYYITYRSSNK